MSIETEIRAGVAAALKNYAPKTAEDVETRQMVTEDVTAALAAVEPLIRERLAQDVEADLNANTDFLTASCRLGYRTAARIVRGESA